MNNITVILVEDDIALRDGMQEFLELSGFHVTAVGSGIEFFKVIIGQDFNVAIIDLGLPDMSGQQLVDFLRQKSDTAVIVLTSSNTLSTRIESYQLGADLFMNKPVDAGELIAAINSLALRRLSRLAPANAQTQDAVSMPTAWLTQAEHWTLVSPQGKAIQFTPKEFGFIQLLVASMGASVSRDSLMQQLYGRMDSSAGAALATLVKRVRQRMEQAGVTELPILTEHGTGYRFTGFIQQR